ncbi:MAG: hypothetical protein JWQ30_1686 [Sediminibacterium sp.]|nr:hypothetical protein [Sediminibacterium sp.]
MGFKAGTQSTLSTAKYARKTFAFIAKPLRPLRSSFSSAHTNCKIVRRTFRKLSTPPSSQTRSCYDPPYTPHQNI